MSSPVLGESPLLPTVSVAGPDASSEFGTAFTAHMVTATWSASTGWSAPVLSERRPVAFDLAAVGLHYGQLVFEGLKAHRQADGSTAIFRPHAHAERMRRSAARFSMPPPPESLFLDAVRLLAGRDAGALSDDPSLSLYLRPILVATEPTLALRPSEHYLFAVIAFRTGGFFATGADPVSVWVSTDFVRAAPGGTGAAKCAGNYAPAFLAQAQAAEHGCAQVVWLDATRRRQVEEMGGMNLFFVHGAGGAARITTPPLSGTILPGVTRDSLLTLGRARGCEITEEPITVDEWRAGCRTGEITETIACGTAAVVVPVGRVRTAGDEWLVGGGATGPVATAWWHRLRAVHRGVEPAPHGWLDPVTEEGFAQ
ncbi:branched-chain amino acid aminotransferase [Amycolatopsis sp. NPDC049252]|uniref:branched-chain amino acid aminotransferase n=1 Tax=Amycolatopsis sp. NPDC049252 TaxID=3363933 RepID=UPI00371AD303